MNEPIKAGDECRVIGGATGRSLNAGRRVIVMGLAPSSDGTGELLVQTPTGVKSLGVVWRCQSQDGKPFVRHDPSINTFVPQDQADFVASWLEKAPKEPPKVREENKELTA